MTQAYSNPNRANDPHALPDMEVFYNEDDPIAIPVNTSHDAYLDARQPTCTCDAGGSACPVHHAATQDDGDAATGPGDDGVEFTP